MSKWLILFCCVLASLSCIGQTLTLDNLDQELLNKHILNEINLLRKKARVDSIANNDHLLNAGNDQAAYMLRKTKVTHYQTFNGNKRTPKNRVDYYGGGFDMVGENCLMTSLNLGASITDDKNPRVTTYEALAAKMVLQWKNSPPHYANMIHPDYKHTYTAVTLGEDGSIYGCQVFGGAEYQDKYKDKNPELAYKQERPRKCKPCARRPPAGFLSVTEEGLILFTYSTTPKFHLKESRMRFYNPWRDGLAADVVLKSQYPCDTFSNFNGRMGVRGIPLPPVYKKDYMGIGLLSTQIVLGRIPDYIDEDYEVNLTVINKKRTCTNTQYWVTPSEFHVDIPLDFGLYPDSSVLVALRTDTLRKKLFFDKSEILPQDSMLFAATLQSLLKQSQNIEKISVVGFASLEGSSESNALLYTKRAAYITDQLKELGFDSTIISISAKENFNDFRHDVKGTRFERLASLTDSLLKLELQNRTLSDSLEFLLEKHRFVSFEAFIKEAYNIEYTPELILEKLEKSVVNEKTADIEKYQRIQYRMALEGAIPRTHIDSISFPFEPKFLKAKHNQAVARFLLDSLSESSVDSLHAQLNRLLPLKEKDKRLNTSIAILTYYQGFWIPSGFGTFNKKNIAPYYDTLLKTRYVNRAVKSQILLNMASYADWGYWSKTGTRTVGKYFYKQAKKEVKKARLDVDKTFEIATYYSFFGEHQFAYNLVRNKIDETKNPEDLIFFLKLIHLNDIKLPRNKYLKYFKKIRTYAGEDFCSFFNNPALNFQILDDAEIKEIWCEECAGN